jgi:hypothetical protein
MRVQLTIGGIALAASLLSGCAHRDAPRQTLQLEVQRSDDKRRTLPGSDLYVVTLQNNGTEAVTLEAIQMAGGYVGGGTYFACGLQTWNANQQQWDFVRPPIRSDYKNNPIVKIELKSGHETEVCTRLLPSQGGSQGDCARFTIQKTWLDPSEVVVSPPFTIGPVQDKSSGPCALSAKR